MSRTPSKKSEIDRLIELASADKPHSAVIEGISSHSDSVASTALSLEDQKDPRPSMWRILLQLRVLLPYLSRAIPLLERGLLGTTLTNSAPSANTGHFDRAITGIEETHRDLLQQLKSQTREIDKLQEQVILLQKAIEKDAEGQQQIVESLTSLKKVFTISAIVGMMLLGGLIGAVLYSMTTHP